MSEQDVLNAIAVCNGNVLDGIEQGRYYGVKRMAMNFKIKAMTYEKYFRQAYVSSQTQARSLNNDEYPWYAQYVKLKITANNPVVTTGAGTWTNSADLYQQVSWAEVAQEGFGTFGYYELTSEQNLWIPFLAVSASAYNFMNLEKTVTASIIDYAGKATIDMEKFIPFETIPETDTQFVTEWLRCLLPQWNSNMGGPQ